MRIPLTPLPKESSQIDSVGWDEHTQTLAVKFRRGGTYHYFDVPKGTYDGFFGDGSAGAHLATHVKPFHAFERQP